MKRPKKPKKKHISPPQRQFHYSFYLKPTFKGLVLVPIDNTELGVEYTTVYELGEAELLSIIELMKEYNSWNLSSSNAFDDETIMVQAIKYNSNYDKELEEYEWAQKNPTEAYEKAMKQYEKDLAVWQRQQRKKKIEKLKQQLKELEQKDVEDSETV